MAEVVRVVSQPPATQPAKQPAQEVLPPVRWYRQVYNEKYGSW